MRGIVALDGVVRDVPDALALEDPRDLAHHACERLLPAVQNRRVDLRILETAIYAPCPCTGRAQDSRGRGKARLCGASRTIREHEHERAGQLHPMMDTQLMPRMGDDERRLSLLPWKLKCGHSRPI